MRSKTSYFNPTLFWKNITRFWPLWALYGVIWLLVLPLKGLNDLRHGAWSYGGEGAWGFHEQMLELSALSIGMAVVFGLLAAMALFSYLYHSRSACMIHSLPSGGRGCL